MHFHHHIGHTLEDCAQADTLSPEKVKVDSLSKMKDTKSKLNLFYENKLWKGFSFYKNTLNKTLFLTERALQYMKKFELKKTYHLTPALLGEVDINKSCLCINM